MLSLSKDSLFWEPADLVHGMHPVFQNGRRKILVKNLEVRRKMLISKRGCSVRQVNFLKGVQVIFGENRKLHNCIKIN